MDGEGSGWIEVVGGRNRDNVGSNFSARGELDNGVFGGKVASVVVAAGVGRQIAFAAGNGFGEVALGGATASGFVGGRNVATVTVDPHEATAEVNREIDWNQRSSLVDLDDVLERWMFDDRENEGFGGEGSCGNGNGEEEEENGGGGGEGEGSH